MLIIEVHGKVCSGNLIHYYLFCPVLMVTSRPGEVTQFSAVVRYFLNILLSSRALYFVPKSLRFTETLPLSY